MAQERILSGWQGVFRAVVLELLPVRELAEHFSPDTGCPTKELHSMAGLVFLADFFDWNAIDAADAYMVRADVQFALNIEPGAECSDRTIRLAERQVSVIGSCSRTTISRRGSSSS